MDSENIVKITVKCFLKVIKYKGFYPIFRCFVGHEAQNCGFNYSRRCSFPMLECLEPYVTMATMYAHKNMFYYAHSADEIGVIIIKTLPKYAMFFNDEATNEGIEKTVSYIVNTLLMNTIQLSTTNHKSMEQIGREAYNLSCKLIIGDSFVEETEEDTAKSIKEFNQLLKNSLGDILHISDSHDFSKFYADILRDRVQMFQQGQNFATYYPLDANGFAASAYQWTTTSGDDLY